MKGFTKSISRRLFKWIEAAFAVIGALLCMQIPLFIDQYQQLLYGHYAELTIQTSAMREAAAQSGKTLEQFIIKFISSSDADFSRQGHIMKEMWERRETMGIAMQSFQEATWQKVFVFIRYADMQVVNATKERFIPGLPLSVEGMVFGLIGIGISFFLFYLLSKPFTLRKYEDNSEIIKNETIDSRS